MRSPPGEKRKSAWWNGDNGLNRKNWEFEKKRRKEGSSDWKRKRRLFSFPSSSGSHLGLFSRGRSGGGGGVARITARLTPRGLPQGGRRGEGGNVPDWRKGSPRGRTPGKVEGGGGGVESTLEVFLSLKDGGEKKNIAVVISRTCIVLHIFSPPSFPSSGLLQGPQRRRRRTVLFVLFLGHRSRVQRRRHRRDRLHRHRRRHGRPSTSHMQVSVGGFRCDSLGTEQKKGPSGSG